MIKLFWWSKVKFQNANCENYGDLLSKYLVEKISDNTVKWINPRKIKWWHWAKKHFLVIGSILPNANKNSIVWGSGIISRQDEFPKATFIAVRGPRSRQRILELGYKCPEVYGDPAILLPKFYSPKVEKEYDIGIIPHYVDYDQVVKLYGNVEGINIINLLTNDIEETTNNILKCKHIISSSLHGVIVSHSYKIPAVWVKFSDKLFGDNVKFTDYFESVKLNSYKPEVITDTMKTEQLIEMVITNPNSSVEEKAQMDLQNSLIKVCPF